MAFKLIFEISDLWRHLAIFGIISKIKPNVPFIGFGFSVKIWTILIIFRQNSSFYEVQNEMIESIWKEFWPKLPVCEGEKERSEIDWPLSPISDISVGDFADACKLLHYVLILPMCLLSRDSNELSMEIELDDHKNRN